MRARAAAAVIALGLVAAPLRATESATESVADTTLFPAGGRLEVDVRRGSVIVAGDPEARALVVRSVATVTGARAGEARAFLRETRVVIGGDEGAVRVEAVYPAAGKLRRSSFLDRILHRTKIARARVDVEIRVPAGASVSIRSERGDVSVRRVRGDVDLVGGRGDLRAEDIGGRLRLVGETGDLSARDIGGDVRARSTSGEIEVRGVGGSLRARGTSGALYLYDIAGDGDVATVSGPVLVEECRGGLRIDAGSGDVDVILCEGTVRVTTRSGDVTIRDDLPLGPLYEVLTEKGDVDFEVPGTPDARLVLTSGTGVIQCLLPIEIKEVTRNRLAAVAGRGGSEVRFDTGSGDLRVSRTD